MGPTRQIDELEAATETARVLFVAGEPAGLDQLALGLRRAVYDASVLHGVCKRELYAKLTGARA